MIPVLQIEPVFIVISSVRYSIRFQDQPCSVTRDPSISTQRIYTLKCNVLIVIVQKEDFNQFTEVCQILQDARHLLD